MISYRIKSLQQRIYKVLILCSCLGMRFFLFTNLQFVAIADAFNKHLQTAVYLITKKILKLTM